MGMTMWLLIVEAGVALFLLVFIVWWTMYSGPKPTGQEPDQHDPAGQSGQDGAER
jgi:hypothetical protein